MINELHNHEKIAIDFDDTLVGHRNSPLLWKFIRDNHLVKEFHIITFRSGNWADEGVLIEEMIHESNQTVLPYMINSISFCNDGLYENFSLIQTSRKQTDTMVPTIILPEETNFYDWKAIRSKELGCTIIVDDRPNWVENGCKKHGVMFVDTADLL